MLKAFEALDADKREALARDLAVLIAEFNTAKDGTVVIPGAYLEAVLTKT